MTSDLPSEPSDASPAKCSDSALASTASTVKLPPLRSTKTLTRSRASVTVTSEVSDVEVSVELSEGEVLEGARETLGREEEKIQKIYGRKTF